jgi:enolase
MMCECIEAAGLEVGVDIGIAIDVAATTLRSGASLYRFERENRDLTSSELIARISAWVRDYPVLSVEDGLHEEDWGGWTELTRLLGDRAQLVGDDLFSTQPSRVRRGIETGAANAVLIKCNQNGTLTGTLEVIAAARAAGYRTIVSARSGETEDSWMADLAVGVAAGQIKIGSLRTSSTLAKYNQLLRIEDRDSLTYAGRAALRLSSTPLPMGSRTESRPSSRTRRR